MLVQDQDRRGESYVYCITHASDSTSCSCRVEGGGGEGRTTAALTRPSPPSPRNSSEFMQYACNVPPSFPLLFPTGCRLVEGFSCGKKFLQPREASSASRRAIGRASLNSELAEISISAAAFFF